MSTRQRQPDKKSVIHVKTVRAPRNWVRKVKPGTRHRNRFATIYNGSIPASGGSVSYPHARRRGTIGASIAV